MADPTPNEVAAAWWARRFRPEDRRDEFRAALLKRLDANPEWRSLYNDYDPEDELLLAVRDLGIECRGCMFSGDPHFPRKTGITKRDGVLYAKEGYGAPSTIIDVQAFL